VRACARRYANTIYTRGFVLCTAVYCCTSRIYRYGTSVRPRHCLSASLSSPVPLWTVTDISKVSGLNACQPIRGGSEQNPLVAVPVSCGRGAVEPVTSRRPTNKNRSSPLGCRFLPVTGMRVRLTTAGSRPDAFVWWSIYAWCGTNTY